MSEHRANTASGRIQAGSWSDLVLSALPFGLIVLDRENGVTFANPAAEQFFELSASILSRRKLSELLPPDSPVHLFVEQSRRRGITASEHGMEIAPVRQGVRLVDMTVHPMADAPGAVLLIIHERSIAQHVGQQMSRLQSSHSVSSMAAILAHEIKNPLAGIRGAAQLIEQNASDSDRALTRLICDETDRIRSLVDRTEIFADRRPIDAKAVNIHQVLDHVKRLAATSFAPAINFQEHYDPSLPSVSGDKDRLIQVFLNLVKNACDATSHQNDGEIVLQTSFKAGVHFSVGEARQRRPLPLEISVRDNGPGVPASIHKSIFEPFVSSKAKGQGLGLAITAKIIADHGGTIECETEPRRTVFRVRLPMHRETTE